MVNNRKNETYEERATLVVERLTVGLALVLKEPRTTAEVFEEAALDGEALDCVRFAVRVDEVRLFLCILSEIVITIRQLMAILACLKRSDPVKMESHI